jgi:hypothetical protein
METIWWKASGDAMEIRSTGEKRTLTKYIHNRLPCNRKQHRYYGYISNKCNLCETTEETQNHILQCTKCEQRRDKRQNYINNLNRYLNDTHTSKETRIVIIEHVRAWLNQTPMPEMRSLMPEASRMLKQAVQEQNTIGWEHWFKGRLTMSWGTLYNYDLQTKNHGMRNQTADKWSKQIVNMNWDFVLEAWTIRNDSEHNTEGDQIKNQ